MISGVWPPPISGLDGLPNEVRERVSNKGRLALLIYSQNAALDTYKAKISRNGTPHLPK